MSYGTVCKGNRTLQENFQWLEATKWHSSTRQYRQGTGDTEESSRRGPHSRVCVPYVETLNGTTFVRCTSVVQVFLNSYATGLKHQLRHGTIWGQNSRGLSSSTKHDYRIREFEVVDWSGSSRVLPSQIYYVSVLLNLQSCQPSFHNSPKEPLTMNLRPQVRIKHSEGGTKSMIANTIQEGIYVACFRSWLLSAHLGHQG